MLNKKHLIGKYASVKDALARLNELGADAILFVVDESDRLIGTLTDGDIRRGFLKGLTFNSGLPDFLQSNPHYIRRGTYNLNELDDLKGRNYRIFPILNEADKVIDILNFRLKKAILPIDVLIMAGGRGQRLMPLTKHCPKPLLKVGEKPIIEYSIDHLVSYGVQKIVISIGYLGNQIKEYFENGHSKDIQVEYIEETEPLGTCGALSLVSNFDSEHILLMNSDILTNIDLADFYKSYISLHADLMVASVPYQIKVPYAVLDIKDDHIISFSEKPTYNYYSNGGIYLFRRSLLSYLKKGAFFNATDFIELLIHEKKTVVHYPILDYWLDIGRHEDFEKAQSDIKHIKF